jgi:type II restriction enzyme
MRSVLCKSIAQSSTQKTDIQIVIYDKRVNQSAELGFSIKSQLGGDSTLFNSNKRQTNFIFQIKNSKINSNEIKRINLISPKTEKIKKRVEAIQELGGKLKFTAVEGDVFNNNLILIDSRMPEILAEIILTYFSTKYSSLKDLTKLIRDKNPLNFNLQHGHNFYEYKIKHFLTDSALGMTGSKVWLGAYDITGGYLIVKKDGDVLCYHVYNRNQFEDYLFANTKLDTPSSTRHEFGTVYEENEQLYFALNLQIRFK